MLAVTALAPTLDDAIDKAYANVQKITFEKAYYRSDRATAQRNMRIGLFGGSFDPFHLAHRSMVVSAWELNAFDRLIIMPVGLAPHKSRRLTMAGYRFEITRKSLSDLKYAEVSSYEVEKPGYSYTIETIEALKASEQAAGRPNPDIYLIYGSDALDTIEMWHRPDLIMNEAKLLIALRADADEQYSHCRAAELNARYNADISFFRMPESDLSSTAIRQKIAEGESICDYLVPAGAKFVRRNACFVYQDALAQLSDETWLELRRLESMLFKTLSLPRLIHSLNVMQYAVHLAQIHGVSMEQAAIAGLIHDCAKCLPMKQQRKYAKKAGLISEPNPDVAHGPGSCMPARVFRYGCRRARCYFLSHNESRPDDTPGADHLSCRQD